MKRFFISCFVLISWYGIVVYYYTHFMFPSSNKQSQITITEKKHKTSSYAVIENITPKKVITKSKPDSTLINNKIIEDTTNVPKNENIDPISDNEIQKSITKEIASDTLHETEEKTILIDSLSTSLEEKIKVHDLNPIIEDEKEICEEEIITLPLPKQESTPPSLKPSNLIIKDKEKEIANFPSNFFIRKNQSKLFFSTKISDYGVYIANYAFKESKKVTVTGYYHKEEKASLGEKRALFIIEKLRMLGIPEVMTEAQSKQADFDFERNKFKGGIDFNFTPIILDEVTIEAIEKLPPLIPISAQENTPQEPNKENKARITKRNTVVGTHFYIDGKYFKNNTFKTPPNFFNYVKYHYSKGKKLEIEGFCNLYNNNDTSRAIMLAKLVQTRIRNNYPIATNCKSTSAPNNNNKEGVTLISK